MIYWIMGSRFNKFTGVGKYSQGYIDSINKEIKVIYVPVFLDGVLYPIGKYLYLGLILFTRSLKKEAHTVILPDESFAFLIPLLSRWNRRYIIVHDCRAVKPITWKEKIKAKLMKYNYAKLIKFDKILCVSTFTMKTLADTFEIPDSKLSVFHNIIDSKSDARITDGPSDILNNINTEDKPVFLYVGSHESRKNTVVLAEAFADLPNLVLIMVGRIIDTTNNFRVNKIAKDTKNIFNLGEVDIKTLTSLYSMADFYINISSFEGFGRTPVEAQLHQIPVLSTWNTGLKEVLEDNSFYLITEPFDVKKLKETINSVVALSEPEINKLIENGVCNAKRFCAEHLSKEMEKLL